MWSFRPENCTSGTQTESDEGFASEAISVNDRAQGQVLERMEAEDPTRERQAQSDASHGSQRLTDALKEEVQQLRGDIGELETRNDALVRENADLNAELLALRARCQ